MSEMSANSNSSQLNTKIKELNDMLINAQSLMEQEKRSNIQQKSDNHELKGFYDWCYININIIIIIINLFLLISILIGIF